MKKIVLISIIAIMFLSSGVVLALAGSVRSALDNKDYIWVGNKIELNTQLRPIVLTGRLNRVLTQQEYALSFAIEETINTLVQTKKASTAQARQFFVDGLNLEPKVQILDQARTMVETGGAGIAEFEVEKGRYTLQLAPINLVNLNVPVALKIDSDQYVIPIGITSGNGTIRRQAEADEGFFIKEAKAQDAPAGTSQIKVVTYYDKNNNGKWDSDESVAPWAGIRVDLVNIDKQAGIELSQQWKDIYLDAAKQGLKASDLVNDLSKNCPTAGVSTITEDERKTFLKRQGEVFGSDDFEITPGRVYSIQGCDVPFYIIGYDLEKQFTEK